MTDQDYAEFIVKDTWAQLKPAVIMYVIALSLYWTFIG